MAQEPNQIARGPASEAATTTDIRAQIEHTRAEMSETIDAIQARLNPTRVMSDAKESVKDATLGRAMRVARRTARTLSDANGRAVESDRLLKVIKANPIPIAFIGIAVTALLVESATRSRNVYTRSGRDSRSAATMERSNSRRMTGTLRRFLMGACAGFAYWTARQAQQSRAPSRPQPTADSDRGSSPITGPLGERT